LISWASEDYAYSISLFSLSIQIDESADRIGERENPNEEGNACRSGIKQVKHLQLASAFASLCAKCF
jgi:hypothetical protein